MRRSDFSWIPSVDAILRELGPIDLPRPAVLAVVRRELEQLRAHPPSPAPSPAEVLASVRSAVEHLSRARLQPLINATGVIIHTNLGRSPMSEAAARAIAEVATQYNTLEYDLAAGERGRRGEYLEHNLALLCEAEAATIVNNCAAALVLILHTFIQRSARAGVIISRGELVQIGGGFRVPEILEAAGATLREVGTTNQTTLEDYRRALDERTAMILKVHRSNFYMEGFVASPATRELAALARAANVPFIEDLGSGATFDTRTLDDAAGHEPTPAEVLREGADLVCFSGDKLLGGPQAGLIAGRGDCVAALKRSPLFRALRADKLAIAGMQATVDLLLDGRDGEVPTHAMLRMPIGDLRTRAERIIRALDGVPIIVNIGRGVACAGGGSLPGVEIESVTLDIAGHRPDQLAERLRAGAPPVIGYVGEGRLKLDLRTVFPHQDSALIDALRALVRSYTAAGLP